jgi:hypothetical protein
MSKERVRMRVTQLVVYLSIAVAQAQNVSIQVDGKPVGTEPTLNLIPGTGIVQACTDNRQNNRVDCTPSLNSAVSPTHDTVHRNENYCESASGTTAYTCRLPYKTLTGYRTGMTFLLNVDKTCDTACSLNIDNSGVVSIKMIDGATDPRGTVIAGQPQWIFYDGRVFRLMGVVSTRDGRGDLVARRLIGSMDMLNYAPIITLDVTAGDMHKIATTNGLGNATVNATTSGLAGQHMWIIIANDPTSAKTVTFGANLKSAGALTGMAGKSATIHFISDGTAWYEVARTTNL